MTILFQGNRTILAGANESTVLQIPANVKQPGQPLELKVSMVWDDFPTGQTSVTIFLSMDGGLTFPKAGGGSWDMPHTFRNPVGPHPATIGLSLGPDENPTHGKYLTDTPAQFTTQVTIEGN